MYLPSHFEETRIDVLHGLMRSQPLTTLVTVAAGAIQADHIPLLLSAADTGLGTLRGHVARANPMWRQLDRDAEALAIFQGPDAYVTPSWYPSKREHGKVVPTWNYAVVHARGTLRVVDDPVWITAHVEALTRQQEAAGAPPWAVADAPADFIERLAGAVVGIEMSISRLSGKWKLSQNQTAENRAGVAAGLKARNSEGDAALAAMLEAAALQGR